MPKSRPGAKPKPKKTRPQPAAATGREVFSINFSRKEYLPFRIRQGLFYGALGYLVLNLLIALTLIFSIMIVQSKKGSLTGLLKENLKAGVTVEGIVPEMTALQNDAKKSLSELRGWIQLRQEPFFAAGKLEALAATAPPRTWISDLQFNRKNRHLSFQATYLINPEDAFYTPGKDWLDQLRSYKDFGGGLKTLEIKRATRSHKGDTEIYEFAVVAEWEAPKNG